MKIQLFALLVFGCLCSYAQEFKTNQDGKLITSSSMILDGKINGELTVRDIMVPDQDFSCLELLGEPIKIDEKHTVVGDDYTFYFEGFKLFYSNVEDKILDLALIEFDSTGKSYIELENGNRIASNRSISKQFKGSNLKSFEVAESGNLSIKFHDYDAAHLTYKREGGVIKKIQIYF